VEVVVEEVILAHEGRAEEFLDVFRILYEEGSKERP
jgi:hypothetical protein